MSSLPHAHRSSYYNPRSHTPAKFQSINPLMQSPAQGRTKAGVTSRALYVRRTPQKFSSACTPRGSATRTTSCKRKSGLVSSTLACQGTRSLGGLRQSGRPCDSSRRSTGQVGRAGERHGKVGGSRSGVLWAWGGMGVIVGGVGIAGKVTFQVALSFRSRASTMMADMPSTSTPQPTVRSLPIPSTLLSEPSSVQLWFTSPHPRLPTPPTPSSPRSSAPARLSTTPSARRQTTHRETFVSSTASAGSDTSPSSMRPRSASESSPSPPHLRTHPKGTLRSR